MPRVLKPQPVDEPIKDRESGDQIQMFLDRNNKRFFFEYQGQRVETAEFKDLPGLAQKALVAARNLEWQSIIFVSYEKRSTWDQGPLWPLAKIQFERFQWAYRRDGHLMRRSLRWIENGSWSTNKGWAYGGPEFWGWNRNLPKGEGLFNPPVYSDTAAWLPYTEELWTGLNQIKAAIEQIEKRIKEIVTTPEGTEMLLNAGESLLRFLPSSAPVPTSVPETEDEYDDLDDDE